MSSPIVRRWESAQADLKVHLGYSFLDLLGRLANRPGRLAERAGMSRQAINQLLQSLEGLGYLVRSDAPNEGHGRIVRFTKRGGAVYAKMIDILRDIECEWSAELGPQRFADLKELLFRVRESPLAREPAGLARATARIPERWTHL